MKPLSELTDGHLAHWAHLDPRGAVITSPDEQEAGIPPAVVLVTAPREPVDLGMDCYRVAWTPDAEDLAALNAGGTVWLSCWGQLPVHQLQVQAPDEANR